MEASLLSFGGTHFGSAQLGDRRRNRRLIHVADQIMAAPGGTLPQKMSTGADLKALYRLMSQEQVTHQAVLTPHLQITREAMSRHRGVVLTIHDTTQLDFTGKKSLKHLGQIGTGFGRGYLCHNTLAVDAHSGEVIGLAGQILHVRARVPKNEPRKKRLGRTDRESRLWKRGSQAVGTAPTEGTPHSTSGNNSGCLWVDVCDRGADLFEYLDHKDEQGGFYIVRSQHDRKIDPGPHHEQPTTLHAYARTLPAQMNWGLEISANGKQSARKTQVALSYAPVTLPPTTGENRGRPLSAWVLRVWELTPPSKPSAGKPLEWILLSNVPVQTMAQARERVSWYERRPIIEEYHKGQKTGCGIELPQFTDESRLEPMIALHSVVAVQLLRLRDTARNSQSAQQPAVALIPPAYVRMINIWRWHQPDRATTAQEFCLALARLGGHLNRKSDGPPGWLTLWRGWQNLRFMIEAAEALERCG